MALGAGVSRHTVVREVSFVAIAGLGDSVQRSVIQDKDAQRREAVLGALSLMSEEYEPALAVVLRYSEIFAAARPALAFDEAALSRILSHRSSLPRPLAKEIAVNVHAVMMRAGLDLLDALLDD